MSESELYKELGILTKNKDKWAENISYVSSLLAHESVKIQAKALWLLDDALWKRLDLIRKIGNRAAHNGRKITEDEAILCLQNLFIFMDYVSYCYSDFYEERQYDVNLLTDSHEEPVVAKYSDDNVDLQALIAENKVLKEELTAKRAEQQQTYVPKPLDLSEYKTRKIYIDSMLLDAGWTEGKDWINEVELPGMPNKSEVGFADYVLYDDMHRPLAVVEAKRTCVDVAKGRQQAKLYADLLEAQYKRRPVVFLTNGIETRIIPESVKFSFFYKQEYNYKQVFLKTPISSDNIFLYVAKFIVHIAFKPKKEVTK